MICMKNLRFSGCPRAKVSHQGPLGSARVQPCTPEDFHEIWVYPFRIWVYPQRISLKLKLYPPPPEKIFSLLFYTTPEEILNFFFKMAPEEFHGSSPGWEGGWMDAIAQLNHQVKCWG